MFPYHKVPITKLTTSSDIADFGHQSLLRALNIGRVVAFTGSGTSLCFDQPKWDDLADLATGLFFSLDNNIKWQTGVNSNEAGYFKEIHSQLLPLAREIMELHNYGSAETPELVQLCEVYFSEAEQLLKKYRISVNDFSDENNNPVCAYSKGTDTWKVKSGYNGPNLLISLVGEKPILDVKSFREKIASRFESTTHNEDSQSLRLGCVDINSIRDEFVKIADTGSRFATSAYKLPLAKDDIYNFDSIRALHNNLGINRFITLNYDLELERMLVEESRSAPGEPYDRFMEFLNKPSKFENNEAHIDDQGKGRSVSLSSGSGRIIRSTSSRSETLADLFAFGAFPTNYNATIHHLHGRVDDPKHMIITPRDYQRIYYGNNDQQRSFDEARHAVFTGSDILVAGLGYSESDVLKPLRDFLELEADRRDFFGKVYYLTRTDLSGSHKSFNDVICTARRKNMMLTQTLHQTYGIFAVFCDFMFADFRDWPDELAILFFCRTSIARMLDDYDDKKKIQSWSDNDFKDAFGKDINTIDPEYEFPGRIELDIARQVANTTDKGAGKRLLKNLEARMISRALVGKFGKIRKDRDKWWKDWSQWPGLRWAVYGNHNYNIASTGKISLGTVGQGQGYSLNNPLVWNQTNLVSGFGEKLISLNQVPEFSQFRHFIELSNKAAENSIEPVKKNIESVAELAHENEQCEQVSKPLPLMRTAAVARISMPPGAGKGRLVSFFTKERSFNKLDLPKACNRLGLLQKMADEKRGKRLFPFQLLFQRRTKNSVDDEVEYIGCFSAHLTFSLEFSSLIFGLDRFLQLLLVDLTSESEWDDDKRDQLKKLQEHRFHHLKGSRKTPRKLGLEVLDRTFKFLSDVCPVGGYKKRAVVIFSYLDRLVDENGDAYSSVHRAFFRMISGWQNEKDHAKLPIDFVFINCDAKKPIRYLSIEQNLPDALDNVHKGTAGQRWLVREEREIALEYWNELKNPNIFAIFEEALDQVIFNHLGTTKNRKKAKLIKDEICEIYKIDTENKIFPELPPGLWEFITRRVLYGYCLAALVFEIWCRQKKDQLKDENLDQSKEYRRIETLKQWERTSNDLAIAISSRNTVGFFTELLRVYRHIDRISSDDPGKGSVSLDFRRNFETPESQCKERLASIIVNHFSLFNYPVSAKIIKACPEIRAMDDTLKDSAGSGAIDNQVDIILFDLVRRGMLSRLWKYDFLIGINSQEGALVDRECPDNFVFALDTKVSSAIRSEMRLSIYGHFNVVPFQVTLYPSQAVNSVNPDASHFKMVSQIVHELVQKSHSEMVSINNQLTKMKVIDGIQLPDGMNVQKYVEYLNGVSEKLRAAYALIRGTFSISVISRLNGEDDTYDIVQPFDEYRSWIRALLNTATLLEHLVHGLQKFVANNQEQPEYEKLDLVLLVNQPFFRDEVTWLYNERALVSFIQGRLFDALPLYKNALQVTSGFHHANEPISYTATDRRIKLNLALAHLERGQIIMAQTQFEEIIRETTKQLPTETPSIIHCFAKGYWALCRHICDDFKNAAKGYKEVVETLRQCGHARGQSIFLRHQADLLRAQSKSKEGGDFQEAIDAINSSEQIAQSIRAIDLQNYALIARARLLRDMEQRPESLENLRHAEKYARSMGNQKMLTEVLKVRGEVLLAEGEATQAGFVTAQSIAMAKRNGMRLRKISAVIIQAQIMMIRNQRKDAARLLREVLLESQSFGYAMKTSAASRLLSSLQ